MKLLIVDDDDQIREGMAYGIQWENMGINKVECCRNGQEALERIYKEAFDIVITDISMPVLSGVELLKQVKAEKPEVCFILISGYKEFEYAKAGIQYGAEGYILKPIHLDELIRIVMNVVHKIEQNQQDAENRKARREAERSQMMNGILRGSITEKNEIYTFLKEECGFENIQSLFAVVFRDERKKKGKETKKDSFFMARLIEYLAGYTYACFEINENESYVLVNVAYSTLRIIHAQQQIRRLVYDVNKGLGQKRISAGISDAGYWKDIRHLLLCSQKALEHCFFKGAGECVLYEDYSREMKAQTEFSGREWNRKIVEKLEERDEEGLQGVIENCIKALYGEERERIREFLLQNMMMAAMRFREMELDMQVQTTLSHAAYFTDMIKIWREYLLSVLRERIEESKYSREIRRALEYVYTHYMEKISAEQMADLLEISPGHFGRIFKQQTGKSFVKYLNRYRMDRAEELLKSSNLKVYEVAEQVGYTDYIYFAQVFRSIKGMAPTDVRK